MKLITFEEWWGNDADYAVVANPDFEDLKTIAKHSWKACEKRYKAALAEREKKLAECLKAINLIWEWCSLERADTHPKQVLQDICFTCREVDDVIRSSVKPE